MARGKEVAGYRTVRVTTLPARKAGRNPGKYAGLKRAIAAVKAPGYLRIECKTRKAATKLYSQLLKSGNGHYTVNLRGTDLYGRAKGAATS